MRGRSPLPEPSVAALLCGAVTTFSGSSKDPSRPRGEGKFSGQRLEVIGNAVYEPSTGQYIMSELADFDEYLRRNPYKKSDDAVTWRKKMIYQQQLYAREVLVGGAADRLHGQPGERCNGPRDSTALY